MLDQPFDSRDRPPPNVTSKETTGSRINRVALVRRLAPVRPRDLSDGSAPPTARCDTDAMPTNRSTSTQHVIGAAIAVGAAATVIVEIVGRLAGGASSTTAVAGAAITAAAGIGTAVKKRRDRSQQRP